jgi:hypothetical protein
MPVVVPASEKVAPEFPRGRRLLPVLKSVSATQVEAYRRCARYWHFQWPQGIKSPPSKSMILGTEFHGAMEKTLKGDPAAILPDKIRRLHDAQLRSLDENVFQKPFKEVLSELLIEERFSIPTYSGGPSFIGVVDVAWKTAPWPVIIDHKTTSDFRYVKTPEELASSPQMSAYAWWAFHHLGPWEQHAKLLGTGRAYARTVGEQLTVGHAYVNTGGSQVQPPKTLWRPVVIPFERAHDEWVKTLDTVRAMERDSWAVVAEDLPPTVESCSLYGGCPFRSKCGFSDPTIKEAFAMADIGGINGAGPVIPLKEKLALARAAREAAVAMSSSVSTEPSVESSTAQKPETTSEPLVSQVVPPDAPPRSQHEDPVFQTEIAQAQAMKDAQAAAPETTKKRGRPKKDVVPETVAPSPSTTVAPVIPTSTTVAPVIAPSTTAAPLGFEVYVDCLPIKGASAPFVLLEDWIGPIFAEAARRASVADFRLVPYGQGKVVLASVLREVPSEEIPRVLVVSSFSTGSNEVLEVLIPRAARVVRALRG